MSIDINQAGNPRRKTQEENGDSESQSSTSRSSSKNRKNRISVTPKDPEKLEEVAEDLGLPKSKIYNMGFRALLEKLGIE